MASNTASREVGAWNGRSIPTFYNGVTFRSRTEARWAIFFDELSVRWFYEYEGFEDDSGARYVPDFWLPDQECFVEVKSPDIDPFDIPQCKPLQSLKRKLLVVNGAPGEILNGWANTFAPAIVAGGTLVSPFGDGPYLFCFCPHCDKVGISFDGRGARVCKHDSTSDKSYTGDDKRIADACVVASNWRFC